MVLSRILGESKQVARTVQLGETWVRKPAPDFAKLTKKTVAIQGKFFTDGDRRHLLAETTTRSFPYDPSGQTIRVFGVEELPNHQAVLNRFASAQKAMGGGLSARVTGVIEAYGPDSFILRATDFEDLNFE